ncbi:hypothetical protein lerEdw1_013361 [Lerista edwardsae]|nr:hypothetical protein lerEdw1_013361 [Lerista edwardsae]
MLNSDQVSFFPPGRGAVRVSVVADNIQVVQGGSALLPCSFHTTAPLSRLNIIWSVVPLADPHHPLQVLAYERGMVVESISRYTGRVSFAFSPTTSATIVLNDTRGSDSGVYQCSVINPPDNALPNIGVVRLKVLVPPSNPLCSSEGSGDEGGNLRFSCTVDEGTPMPTFTWEKIPPAAYPLALSYEAVSIFGSPPPPGGADDHRVVLTLRNLTTEASGLYRCTAANMLGSASCALELRVHIAPHGATSLVVGIALVLSMGSVLLVLLVLVLWLHHRSVDSWMEPEEDESYNEIRIDSFSLGRRIATSGDMGTAAPLAKPLWIFTSPTPNTTYARRECRPRPGTVSRDPLPGGPHQPASKQWGSSGRSEQQGSLSGSEEEKPAGSSPLPKPAGFLV